jgi:hypothetical protein
VKGFALPGRASTTGRKRCSIAATLVRIGSKSRR